MPRKSQAFLKRSAAAKLGWQHRKRAERAEHRKRSEAAKRGWLTSRRNVRKSVTRKLARGKSRRVLDNQVSKATLPKVMWRATVSAPYYMRNGRKRGSVASSYMVRGWYKTKKAAQHAVRTALTDRAIEGRFNVLENDMKTWWTGHDDAVNTEVRSVPYDARFLGTTEEQDEVLL